MMDAIALWVGRATMLLSTLAVLVLAAWYLCQTLWHRIQEVAGIFFLRSAISAYRAAGHRPLFEDDNP